MRFTANTKVLLSAIRAAKPVAAGRSALPFTKGALLVADPEDGVYLQTTNLEVTSTAYVHRGVVLEAGTATVADLAMLEGVLAAETAETITVTSDGGEVHFGLTRLRGIGDDMPTQEAIGPIDGDMVELNGNADLFTDALRTVGVAASKDQARPILTGVYFDKEDGRLRLVATDSYRLAWYDLPIPAAPATVGLVPGKWLARVPKMTGPVIGFEFGVRDGKGAEWAQISGTDGILTMRTIEGTYPNYRQLIAKQDDEITLTAGTAAWLEALKRLKPMVDKTNIPVRVVVANGKVLLRVVRQDVGDAIAEVKDAIVTGDPGAEYIVAYNHEYLTGGITALNRPGAGVVSLTTGNPLKPAMVTGTAKPGFNYLLMPVRL
ncbi:MAG: DNA polymerase III subunit beta [Actinomycetota bacterium]